jgi:hypothetical protein
MWPFGPQRVEVPFRITDADGPFAKIDAIMVRTDNVREAETAVAEFSERLGLKLTKRGNL